MITSPRRLESGPHFGFDRSHHLYFILMLKMTKWPILISILFLGSVFIMSVQGAPSSSSSSSSTITFIPELSRSIEDLEEEERNHAFPSPPTRRSRDASSSTTTSPVQQVPIHLNFIRNPRCELHRNGEHKTCGLRELDLPGGASGIRSWNPSICGRHHCKCVATKEVHRVKRTIADNKTTLDYHRFRVFECV